MSLRDASSVRYSYAGPLRDDDYITETRYLQQPEGMTSVITGFNASIRIHCCECKRNVREIAGSYPLCLFAIQWEAEPLPSTRKTREIHRRECVFSAAWKRCQSCWMKSRMS